MNAREIQFLKAHEACQEGLDWVVENCDNLQDAWDKVKPEWLIWLATETPILTDRELHEFGLWCANQVKHLMTDERTIKALEAKRKWLDGEIADEELCATCAAAKTAWVTSYVNWPAARAAAWVAWAEAWVIASTVSDALKNQAQWLRSNCKPNFKIKEVEK